MQAVVSSAKKLDLYQSVGVCSLDVLPSEGHTRAAPGEEACLNRIEAAEEPVGPLRSAGRRLVVDGAVEVCEGTVHLVRPVLDVLLVDRAGGGGGGGLRRLLRLRHCEVL